MILLAKVEASEMEMSLNNIYSLMLLGKPDDVILKLLREIRTMSLYFSNLNDERQTIIASAASETI